MAATVLVGLNVLASVAATIADWNSYRVVRAFVADESVTEDELNLADLVSALFGLLSVGILVVAGVVFIWWLRRARVNAELLAITEHRHSRGWVIGAWFCPIVNLWFPKQIVDDVWRGSDAARRRPAAGPPAGGATSPLTVVWWSAWIVSNIIEWFRFRAAADPDIDTLRVDAIASSVSTLLTIVAGVAIAMIIRRITGWQRDAMRAMNGYVPAEGQQPTYPEFRYQPVYPQPDQPQPVYPQPVYPQPVSPQAVSPQAVYPQPDYPQPVYQQRVHQVPVDPRAGSRQPDYQPPEGEQHGEPRPDQEHAGDRLRDHADGGRQSAEPPSASPT